LKAGGVRAIVIAPLVAATAVAAFLNATATARAADVAVVVAPKVEPEAFAGRGAVGLLVPGSGAWVSRAGAMAGLLRGKVRTSDLGGIPTGPKLIEIAARPGDITIYVSLPPPGRHPNRTRYGIAIVGGGYEGTLYSKNTRVPGLVSVADVAPAALALRDGREPPIQWRSDNDAAEDVRALDGRFERLHAARFAARVVLIAATSALALLALLLHSATLARAAVLSGPLVLAGSVALAAAHLDDWWWSATALAILAGPVAIALAAALHTPLRLGVALLVGLLAFLVVLVAAPDVPALAALGPHPDGGGRFYGLANSVETLLLVPVLLIVASLGSASLVPIGALALVTVGWSRAGADGGGLIVFAAALAILGVRLAAHRLTLRRALVLGIAAVTVGLALVGIDAVTGGSSHVTRSVGSGPTGLARDLWERLDHSYRSATSTWLAPAVVVACVAAVLALVAQRPRTPLLEALGAGLLVSLLVNDSPRDVALVGFLSCAALWVAERTRAVGYS
jgi:hypothetical protein